MSTLWVTGCHEKGQQVALQAHHEALALGVPKSYVVLQQLGLHAPQAEGLMDCMSSCACVSAIWAGLWHVNAAE